MYATIRHGARGAASTDKLAEAGRALTARLGAAPGFVACLLLETQDGGYSTICICEDRAGLAAAEELVAGWSPDGGAGATPARRIMGEVVAQKGL